MPCPERQVAAACEILKVFLDRKLYYWHCIAFINIYSYEYIIIHLHLKRCACR